jgi:hypothetical protein
MGLTLTPASGAVQPRDVDFGTIAVVDDNASGANPSRQGYGAICEVTVQATVEINDGNSDAAGAWRPLLRADTAAPFTALATGSYPIATTFRRIRCMVGAVRIRPFVRS